MDASRISAIKLPLFIMLAALVSAAIDYSLHPNLASADQTRTTPVRVAIHDDGLEPSNLNLLPGTTVIWINQSDKPARIKFVSQPVSTTCREPVGFVESSRGIRRSAQIVGGSMSSLCFIQREQHQYEVDLIDDSNEDSAQVVKTLHGSLAVK